jgi:hypothetical protein
MPKRGSVQFLLLFFRPRALLGLGIGATAVTLLLAGLIEFRSGFPLLEKGGLAQAVRQSVWEQALAGQSQPDRWPWEDLSVNMSLVPAAKVPRLGLSAEIVKHAVATPPLASSVQHRTTHAKARKASAPLGDVAISDVTIGDSITFTAADGEICVYRVSGRRVVDPHLAHNEAARADAETSLFACGPFGRLIIDAAQGTRTQGIHTQGARDDEPQAAPQIVSEQRNL